MLKSSGITRDEVLENHEDVLNLLEFQDNFQNQNIPEQLKPSPLPEDTEVTIDDLVSKEDPTSVFSDLVKIGEGYCIILFIG